MKELIEEYTELCRRDWNTMNRKSEVLEEMDKICRKEAASFSRKARRMLKAKEGSGWTFFEAKGSANVDHRTSPVTVTTDIKIECGFYAEEIRGAITIYGDIGKADEILGELNRLLNGEVSK